MCQKQYQWFIYLTSVYPHANSRISWVQSYFHKGIQDSENLLKAIQLVYGGARIEPGPDFAMICAFMSFMTMEIATGF